MKTNSNTAPSNKNTHASITGRSSPHLAAELIDAPPQRHPCADDQEEYRYCLIENCDGANEPLKKFIDLLPNSTAQWLFSIRLHDRVLTLSWLGRIPRSWNGREATKLPNGTDVSVVHEVLNGRHLAPSLVQSLRYLAHVEDDTLPFHGCPPENVVDAIGILDSLGLISVEWDVRFEALEMFFDQRQRLLLSKRLRNLVINPSAREFLV